MRVTFITFNAAAYCEAYVAKCRTSEDKINLTLPAKGQLGLPRIAKSIA